MLFRKCTLYEKFIEEEEKEESENMNEIMNMNESQNVMNACNFSLDCCPSTYSSDRGCMCMNKKEEEVLKTRGYNKTDVDGFGY
jgi:uncharacterized membrane protein YheB (UPF0754 family)